jgi:hypothetical protein
MRKGGHFPVQTSSKTPIRHDHDLIVVPDVHPPRRWGLIAVVVAAILVTLLAGGAVGYAIRQADVRDLEAQLSGSASQQQVAVTDVGAALQRVDGLERRIDELRANMEVQRRAVGVLRGSNHEQSRQLTQAKQDLETAQAELRATTGPPLSEGTFSVKVVAVGASQSPSRIVLDLGRWFTGTAAHDAAAADGLAAHTVNGNHPRYFRNREPAWRIMPLDPAATATFWRRGSHLGPSTISIADFQQLVRSGAPWAVRVSNDPFWATVQNGVVTGLQQLRYA